MIILGMIQAAREIDVVGLLLAERARLPLLGSRSPGSPQIQDGPRAIQTARDIPYCTSVSPPHARVWYLFL